MIFKYARCDNFIFNFKSLISDVYVAFAPCDKTKYRVFLMYNQVSNPPKHVPKHKLGIY